MTLHWGLTGGPLYGMIRYRFKGLTMTIAELLETQDCAYLAVFNRDGTVFKAEIQTSDYWVGGDEGGYTNDSNICFETPEQAQRYYDRNYSYFAFEEAYEAEEKCEELS